MKIKRKKEKKLQVSNVTVPDLVLLLELKKNQETLLQIFLSCLNYCADRVCMGPGISWNFIVTNWRTGKSLRIMTSPGSL